MSIYSGFATRQQQHAYDVLLLDLIGVLQKRIIKFYTGEQADEVKFNSILLSLHHHLAKMEESKYLDPKMAPSIEELLTVTAAASAQQPQPANPVPPPLTTPIVKLPSKPSRVFSSNSRQPHCSTYGKIKHQSPSHQPQNNSSRQDTASNNPEQPSHLQSYSQPHHPKEAPVKKKWNLFDPPTQQQQQQKNVQYIIREYISRGQQRRKYKGKRNPMM